jgi:hypothetical protein
MKTVRVYYAGIPAKNTKSEKKNVLKYFHQGVGTNGCSTAVERMLWQPSDLAVIQGWVHAHSGNSPHLQFRKEIIQNQKNIGKNTLAIDSNLFLYKDPKNTKKYLRFSLNDVFPVSGNYFTDNIDTSRWSKIKQDLGFDLQSWRNTGNHILVCLQRNGGWSMGDVDVMDWCNKTVKKIKQHTDRPIVLRTHPGDQKRANIYIKKLKDLSVSVSENSNIQEDLQSAWACVTYNSSPGVASAIEGIPVFVTDSSPENSQAYDVCNTDLSQIESPLLPERQQWIEKISMCHFNFDDLKKGVAWNIIKDYL